MAAIKFTATKCSPSLPVIEKVCFKVVGDNRTFYVTSQPVYIWPGASPYQAIAQAGVQAVVSVRDPSETIIPFNPFDLTETDQLILSSVATSNIPLPHIAMSQALFDRQAFHVATALNAWKQPGLIHCSSGDRASAGFAAFLITYCGYQQPAGAGFRAASPRAAEPAIRRLRKGLSAEVKRGRSRLCQDLTCPASPVRFPAAHRGGTA
jgi:protein tyrosine phosphatase (PTP) superfamily phosphohydrolase (DUF442 family)